LNKDKERENFYCYEDDEIDLYELWLILKRRKLTVLITTIFFVAISAAYAFLATPVYKTEASLVPLGESSGGMSSLFSSLPIPIPTQSEGVSVKAVLKSRTLKEKLIRKFNLLPLLFKNKWNPKTKNWKTDIEPPSILDGVEKLDNLISVSEEKDTGVLKFSILFPEDYQMPYRLAEEALKITDQILNEKSAKLAKLYTAYIKAQLDKAKQKYKLLEKVYQDFLKGKIKEVPFIFDESDVKLIEKLGGKTELPSSFVNLPEYRFNMEKLKLQMKIASQLLATLTQQYELAKAQELKEKVSFQVIDPPYVPDPEDPYKPKKKLILALGFIWFYFRPISRDFFSILQRMA